MKFILWVIASIFLLFSALSATVFVTHGLGTDGISYYQSSKYIDLIRESAQRLGHKTVCVQWLDSDHPAKKYAGILPQERILGAVKIAKEILNEIKAGNQVILVGHGYGGQVMACATRLLNPENTKLTDSFIYELISLIKNSGQEVGQAAAQNPEGLDLKTPDSLDIDVTRAISLNLFVKTLVWGWQLSQSIFDVIESSNIVNSNLIKLIKQNISLNFVEETKAAWRSAFDQVQSHKNKLFKDALSNFDYRKKIQTVYTIGTVNNGDMAFSPDMNIVQNHVNFYSSSDSFLSLSGLSGSGKKLAEQHPRVANIEVLFEPTRAFSPKHIDFCGNILMAPWILQIPNGLKAKKLAGFDRFEWGKAATVTFYSKQFPAFDLKA